VLGTLIVPSQPPHILVANYEQSCTLGHATVNAASGICGSISRHSPRHRQRPRKHQHLAKQWPIRIAITPDSLRPQRTNRLFYPRKPRFGWQTRFGNSAEQNLTCAQRILQSIVRPVLNAEMRGNIRKAVLGLGEYRPSPSDDSGRIKPATGAPFGINST